jgi:2-hydroxymuconate-semialdehyde hydrolase
MPDLDELSTETSEELFGLKSRWLESGPDRYHYHDAGSGTPMLLLHGSAIGVTAAVNWYTNFADLSDSARVLAVDMLGYGFTDYAESTEVSLGGWVDQVIRFLDGLGIDRVLLVGNSLGGRVALETTVLHPERVAGLITMGSPGPNHRRSEVVKRHAAPALTRAGIYAVMSDMVADKSVIWDKLVDFRYQLAGTRVAQQHWAQAVPARDASALNTVDAEAITQFSMPATVFHGREDKVVPSFNAIDLAQAIPQADLVMLSNCGHWVQIERRTTFNAIVLATLERVESAAAASR